MQARTTMARQFGLLYNEPFLKCEIVASLGVAGAYSTVVCTISLID